LKKLFKPQHYKHMEEKTGKIEKADVLRPKVEIPLKLRERPNQHKASVVSTPSRTSSKDELSKDEMIARLQAEVARWEKKAKRMHSKMKHVKAKYVASQNDSEAEFEFRINRLLRQTGFGQAKSTGSLPLLGLKDPLAKGRSLSCEQSTEPTRLKPLKLCRKTKSLPVPRNEEADLSKVYQAEMVVTNLKQKLDDVNRQKENLESELGLASTELVNKLTTIVEKLPAKEKAAKKILSPAPRVKIMLDLETKLDSQSTSEKMQLSEFTDVKTGAEAVVDEKQQFLKEAKAVHEENRALSKLLNKFKDENSTLKRKIKRITDEAMLLRLEKAHLEQNFEIASEMTFNRSRKNRERANSITSSTDSISECSLSHLSYTHNDRERKAFMEESNKLTQDYAQRNELDILTINSSPSFSANEPMLQIVSAQSGHKHSIKLEPPSISTKVRQPKLRTLLN